MSFSLTSQNVILQRQTHLPVWEGVQIMELIECAAGALHLMARERACRAQMCDMQLVPIFVNLLTYEHESTQRAACGALNEIAQDYPSGCQLIEREGATAILTEILRSRNFAISE